MQEAQHESSKPNPRAVVGNNSVGDSPFGADLGARMPTDKNEALKYYWLYYQRIMEQRKYFAEYRSASAKDIANDQQCKPVLVKLGFRMARMTPEKRQKHADQQNIVLALFGYSPLGVADVECSNPKMLAALETDKWTFEQPALDQLSHERFAGCGKRTWRRLACGFRGVQGCAVRPSRVTPTMTPTSATRRPLICLIVWTR